MFSDFSLHIESEILVSDSRHLASPFGRLPELLFGVVPDVGRRIPNPISVRNNNQGHQSGSVVDVSEFSESKIFKRDWSPKSGYQTSLRGRGRMISDFQNFWNREIDIARYAARSHRGGAPGGTGRDMLVRLRAKSTDRVRPVALCC